MTSTTKSFTGVKTKTFAYENFQGLDTSRDVTSLDTGKDQHLSVMKNCTADWRGQVVRDPSAKKRTGEFTVKHINFFNTSEIAYAEETGASINLVAEAGGGQILQDAYPVGTNVSSVVFDQALMFFAPRESAYRYDGSGFALNQSPALNILRPAFGVSIQRRLAVAGIPSKPTEVHFSRVDSDDVFPDDESETSTDVLRASFFDIASLLRSADIITGLGSFEQNRLVVFTNDRAVIYKIDPDLTVWTIDESANINIGTFSHNTIQNAGTDLLFASRSGIHSIKRSEENGILVYSYSLSDKVDLLYRELYNSVPNKQDISAVFDQDNAQYHLFFPKTNQLCTRLTLAMNPEGGQAQPKFSTADFLQARCGAFLAGKMTFGTAGGVYEVLLPEEVEDGITTPEIDLVTPFLWHGSLYDTKQTESITVQATGKGILEMTAIDDKGHTIGSLVFEVNDDQDDNYFEDVPLSRQYERKWSHRYKAAQYRFRSREGNGLLRIIGFAVNVRN